MFAKTIVDSDAFLDMPLSAQCLYFHLNMRADDDGFINNARMIQHVIGASEADRALLLQKRFILAFDSGVVVIKHWRVHNYIRRDTYRETLYTEEKAALDVKADGAYTDCVPCPSQGRDEAVDAPLTQDRIGQDRIGKDRIGQDSLGQERKKQAKTAEPERSRHGDSCTDSGRAAAERWHLPE